MKRISVVGCGYVGLVTGAGLAEFGNEVVCIDIDEKRIKSLRNMEMPFYEPGLADLVRRNYIAGKLFFEEDMPRGIKGRDAIMIAVQTPQGNDGIADLTYLTAAAGDIAREMNQGATIIIKSTVPVGTAARVEGLMNRILDERKIGFSVQVVSNPEFLREGSAVNTFLEPDRIVIGMNEDGVNRSRMEDIYRKPAGEGVPLIFCSNETAETIKYASNSFLAMKISFINQIALLCEKTGADIKTVADAIGKDSRISPHFLNPGPGYGGSCFPKDTKAFVRTGEEYGVDLSLIRTADEANERHKMILAEKIARVMKQSGAARLAVWGLSFKAGTGDMRNSPALTIIPELCRQGIKIKAYDPEAMPEAARHFKDRMN
ncbi:MAG: UDP-glucose/GDP-mannose dehydrogenase family protein, partial [Clostridia bacterium]|nr:UDP-glucose/GDP-mannose dehydrogenase family protein [Clostridia bacterium]